MYYVIQDHDGDSTNIIALLETPKTLDIPALYKTWKAKLYEGLVEPEPATGEWIFCAKAGLATPQYAKHHLADPAYQQWKLEYDSIIQAKKARERDILNRCYTTEMIEAFVIDELIQHQACCRLNFKEEKLK